LNCGNFECGVVEKGGGELVCLEEENWSARRRTRRFGWDILFWGWNGSGDVGWGKR